MAWSQEQLKNAAIIYQVGRQMGLGARDIQTAIITAMVESNLINVNYGDRDSLGLFQQRPSQGWGTPEQVTDPQYAARRFYKALVGMGDRRFRMGMGEAAQAVQRSAFPERYAQRIPSMRMIWPKIQQTSGETPMSMDGQPYGLPSPYVLPEIQQQTPAMSEMLGATTDPEIPSADVMLGAWGIDSPQPVDPMTDGLSTFISPGTNSIITEISRSGGRYEVGVDGWRKGVIEAAKSALGTPYVWGGNSLSSGVDCSGLIQQAFARVGIDMPRISYLQANRGTRVGRAGLQPGDLVAWDNSSRNNGADHIAIYLGNGYIIEAPRPGLSVRIRRLGKGLEGGWGVHLGF